MPMFRVISTSIAALCCLSVLVVSEALAQNLAPQRPKLPKGIVAEYDVKYVANGDAAKSLGVHFPEAPADKPLPLPENKVTIEAPSNPGSK